MNSHCFLHLNQTVLGIFSNSLKQEKAQNMSPDGKVVLVSAARSGIGTGAACHLEKLGARVSIVGRNEKQRNEVAKEIKTSGSEAPLVFVADVTKGAERSLCSIT